jgi:hypothetical protein
MKSKLSKGLLTAQNQRLKSLPKIVTPSGAFWGSARGILSPLFRQTGIYV